MLEAFNSHYNTVTDNFLTSTEMLRFSKSSNVDMMGTVTENRMDNATFYCIGQMSKKRGDHVMLPLSFHLIS